MCICIYIYIYVLDNIAKAIALRLRTTDSVYTSAAHCGALLHATTPVSVKLSVAPETVNRLFETACWLKRQDGKREQISAMPKRHNRKAGETGSGERPKWTGQASQGCEANTLWTNHNTSVMIRLLALHS